ncbi:hypothetical protein GCM10010517_19610 [Streptosporangium fragile]|uniref:Uncharacterized protein n=1 Tax=Streptosporangium fragile TaxID=46186 RepID=A0ABN3VVJ4_9ACTN
MPSPRVPGRPGTSYRAPCPALRDGTGRHPVPWTLRSSAYDPGRARGVRPGPGSDGGYPGYWPSRGVPYTLGSK